MPFSTNAELETAIGQWLARDDLATNIPDFVKLFEAWAATKLKVRPMQLTTTLTPSSGSADLPADYLGWVRATVTSSTRIDMEYVHPTYLQALLPSVTSDTPRFFTIEGGALKTRSSDTTGIEFVYNAKNVTVSSSLNWLFTNFPHAYLYGSLFESADFTDDPDKLAKWKLRRDEIMDEVTKHFFRERGHMAVRIIGAHP